jgi:hypothetical protein
MRDERGIDANQVVGIGIILMALVGSGRDLICSAAQEKAQEKAQEQKRPCSHQGFRSPPGPETS